MQRVYRKYRSAMKMIRLPPLRKLERKLDHFIYMYYSENCQNDTDDTFAGDQTRK